MNNLSMSLTVLKSTVTDGKSYAQLISSPALISLWPLTVSQGYFKV